MHKNTREYNLPTMATVRAKSERGLFGVVSLFAGCGGSSTGYRLAGGKVLGANEFIDTARETYAINYPDVVIMPEDIRKLTGAEILRRVGIPKGTRDILDGSPPHSEKRGELLAEFARLVNEIKPSVFVSEGAADDNIGSKQSSLFNEHKETMLYTFESFGYRVDYKILNAANFEVPRVRERMLLIGVREDLSVEPSFPRPTHRDNRIPSRDKKFSIPEWLWMSSFPDDFILMGTPEEQWNQIESAVPPLLMKAIARTIWQDILGPMSGIDVSARDIVQSGQNGDALKDAVAAPEPEKTVEEEQPPEEPEEELPDGPGEQESIEF